MTAQVVDVGHVVCVNGALAGSNSKGGMGKGGKRSMWHVDGTLTGSDSEGSMGEGSERPMWHVDGMLTRSDSEGSVGEGSETRGNEVNNIMLTWCINSMLTGEQW